MLVTRGNVIGGVSSRRRTTVVAHGMHRRRWIVGGVLSSALVASGGAKPASSMEESGASSTSSQDGVVGGSEVRRVELSPIDAFYVVEGLKLGEVIDNYLEMVRLNNAEHVLCNDAIFLHLG